MSKYKSLINRVENSVDYWSQAAMRQFVLDIDKRMVAQEISRAKLAEKIGASPAYVSKALRGDVNFTLETMTKFAIAVDGRLHVAVIDRDLFAPWTAADWCYRERSEARDTRTMQINLAANDAACQPAAEQAA